MNIDELKGKSVVIIDDHKLFSSGLCSILEDIGLKVLTTFENGRDALPYIKSYKIDFIFTDINMPKMDGIKLTKKVKTINSDIKVIVLSMYEETSIIKEAFEAGAMGYLSKNTDSEEITTALLNSLKGNRHINKRLMHLEVVNNKEKDQCTVKYSLTNRERDVLKYMLEEHTNQKIADLLQLSKRTVETHRKNIFVKLNVKNSIGLTKIALKYKLVD